MYVKATHKKTGNTVFATFIDTCTQDPQSYLSIRLDEPPTEELMDYIRLYSNNLIGRVKLEDLYLDIMFDNQIYCMAFLVSLDFSDTHTSMYLKIVLKYENV